LVHQVVTDAGKSELSAIQGGAALPDDGARQDKAISTHFIIDTIAGRESVLWRVFIPAERADAMAANATTAVSPQGAEQLAPAMAPPASAMSGSRKAARSWRLQILGDRIAERAEGPVYCSAAGCLLEVGPKRSAEIANRLVDGTAIDVRIEMNDAGAQASLQLPARGFSASFKDLVRHRREEERQRR
jgi:hypothetical protein